TARICGICPVAYQMSSVHAIEAAFGVNVDDRIRTLRRLLYCGEWIESHALHVYMLHAPDFLGYDDSIAMAKDHPELVTKGLKLKKLGNDLMTLLGGREIHPINVRVGGFYRAPTKNELRALIPAIEEARTIAAETVNFVGSFSFPNFEQEYEFVALRHEDEYPFNEGRIVSNRGLDIPIQAYNDYFEERHVARSNALHSVLKERGNYFVGPLARYSLNFDKLPSSVQEAAVRAGLRESCHNPFKSIIVRAVEMLYACEEALRIVHAYQPPARPFVEIQPRASTGFGCTEAPRGICFHSYKMDDQGLIQQAQIVPPTSQNQLTMESDLRNFVAPRLHLPDDQLQWQCEQAIRNYDPCISCATHFLKLEVDRS
ncbi:MAG: Ni/Fe hydrogenase subunit alpha, partial [Anaerolineales bacterium]|nr:Ni/Fe hydrogenase subunit alpha [Anaerolineales bacterium]